MHIVTKKQIQGLFVTVLNSISVHQKGSAKES